VQRLLVKAERDPHRLLLPQLLDHLPFVRPHRMVVVGEGHPRLARNQQLEIVDGGGGGLRVGVGVGHVLSDDTAQRPAQRIPHAPGAARHDAEGEFLSGQRRPRKEQRGQDEDQRQVFRLKLHGVPPE